MRNLTDEQIEFIAEDIRIRGVFTQGLQENLLDHICCCIEQHDDDRPFEEIYLQTLEAFGQGGLQEVQDETLYLINQPYFSKMKKIAYFSGTLASMSLICGALFKVMHWPGANIMLIIGTLTLTFLFLPYFFYMQFKEQTEKKGKIIAALGMITAALLCISALFKILHWPGAGAMIVGFTIFFVLFIPLYMINGMRNPLTKISTISNGFLFASIGGFVMLLSFQNPSKAVTDSLTSIQQKQESLLASMQAKTNNKPLVDFVAACDKAMSNAPNASGNGTLGNGDPVDGRSLETINSAISTALIKLNSEMSTDSTWKPLTFEPISPTLYGSVKFQVLQLESMAYVNAIDK